MVALSMIGIVDKQHAQPPEVVEQKPGNTIPKSVSSDAFGISSNATLPPQLNEHFIHPHRCLRALPVRRSLHRL